MTWESRDLPVLRAVVDATDEGGWIIEATEIAERTGLSDQDVQNALWALGSNQPPYFEIMDASTMSERHIHAAHQPTGHARRTVGTWPTPDLWADRLIAALTEAAENETDPDKKSKLRKAADALGSMGGQVLGGVITSYVTHAAGISY